MKKLIIAVDFDLTIAVTDFPIIIKPVDRAFEYLQRLNNDGHELILWTCRENESLNDAISWLAIHGMLHLFDAINKNTDSWKARYPQFADDQPSRKIFADIYIEDKVVGGLPEWKEIYNHITKLAKEEV